MSDRSAIEEHRALLARCEQCGYCSSACPLTFLAGAQVEHAGFNVRRILRHVELGLEGELARTPLVWECTTCGRCEATCPNGVPVLALLRELRARAARGPEREGPPPCVRACPAGIDVPGYLRLIARGEPAKAQALILERVPFPATLGRVCPRPCEERCRRGVVDAPVAICALKRYAADSADSFPEAALAVQPDTGKRVAVIGAGPAGLSAAFYLRRKGHAVTVFEERARAGGMLRYGIPRYKLPAAVLEREIEQILRTGVELRTGQALGEGFDAATLRAEGFDAVFVATGLQAARRLALEGADAEHVTWGIDFLLRVGAGEPVRVGPRVVVIGGGDVAIDVALTALRVGAEDVRLVSLERLHELPAHPHEVALAAEEGVRFIDGWGPERMLVEHGRVRGVELARCTAVFDAQGAFAPAFSDERRTEEADEVILAIGQRPDPALRAGLAEVERAGELLARAADSGATSLAGVFAAGEIATGPGTLIAAIADAKRVAAAIDRHLGGDGILDGEWAERADTSRYDGRREAGFAERPRSESPELPLAERQASFAEVRLGLDADAALAEAGRCLQCDLEQCPEAILLRAERSDEDAR